jgi:S1-C subfamily serine protease
LAVISGFGACVRGGTGGTTILPAPPQDCPVCPTPEEEDSAPDRSTDLLLADSEIDDSMTDAARGEFIRRNIKSTVRIHVSAYTEEDGNDYYGGTGTIIDDRHILTAGHVVRHAEYVTVTTRRVSEDGQTIEDVRTFPVEIIVRDTNDFPDIAILRVRHNEILTDHMPLSPRGYEIERGQLLWHFGKTTRRERGEARGIVGPRDRRTNVRGMTIIDCLVQRGDSGGPVINSENQLVGVILKRNDEDVIGFFIILDDVRAAVTRMLGRPLF